MSVTEHPPINQDKTPIRVFKSDFLESFTHVHWVTVPILWVPVVLACLVLSIAGHLATLTASSALGALTERNASSAPAAFPWYVPIGYLVGLALWTLAEYNVHRFVFHLRPRAPWQERMVYLAHGIHHHQPHCKTRLVLPPAFSVPMAVIFFGLFYLVLTVLLGAGQWLLPVFAGFLTGYIVYDLIHYATHHAAVHGRVWKYLKKHHMYHHFKTPNARYGVSSPLWDYVYGTLPA